MAAFRYFLSLLIIPASFIFAGIAVIAFMAAYTNPNSSAIITYAGLFMPVILLTNLCLVLYWAINKSWWTVVPIAAILLNINYILSIFQFSSTTPEIPQGVNIIKVASYNVGQFNIQPNQPLQYPISKYLMDQNVNIACFQEYIEHPQINADTLSKLMQLPYQVVEYLKGSANRGSAIFSQFPIVNSGKINFESKTNDAMWADIRINNQMIRVINCHLETTDFYRKRKELTNTLPEKNISIFKSITSTLKENSRRRAQQADIIRQMIDTLSYPVIVCGDFNDLPSTYTYHRIKGNLKDSFRTSGKGYCYTFRGIHKLLRIDYILYSSDFNCITYYSENKNWSDHKPIICELYL